VNVTVSVTTFLAAGIEVIEMVAIVVAVGSTRSWRAALVGAGGGLSDAAVRPDEERAAPVRYRRVRHPSWKARVGDR